MQDEQTDVHNSNLIPQYAAWLVISHSIPNKKLVPAQNLNIGIVFGLDTEIDVMLPVWFFITLIIVIAYLLYVTRTTEDNIIIMSKNQVRKLQYWIKDTRRA